MSNALSGNDSLTLNNRIFSDYADGKALDLKFPNPIASAKTGKNGNSLFAQNQTGKRGELTIRLIKGSGDDQYLNGLTTQQQANFPGTVLNQGQYVKQIGDGKGNIAADTYILSGGIITHLIDAESDVEGGTDQNISIWKLTFTNAPRTIT